MFGILAGNGFLAKYVFESTHWAVNSVIGELLRAAVEDRTGNLKSFEKQQQLLVVRSE
jgi:hypothetical protein